MSKPPEPTVDDIQALVSFLPVLYGDGVEPVVEWKGGEAGPDGVRQFPFPEYTDGVRAFIEAASAACWNESSYDPAEAGKRLRDAGYVAGASIGDLRHLLTFIVRGERFCDGHWEAMIKAGHVRRVLERLRTLKSR